MEYNLLMEDYSIYYDLYLRGLYSLNEFQKIESEYVKKYKLFIVNLN